MKNPKQNEELVKELYEKYPYPSRTITDEKQIFKYSNWLERILDEDKHFWEDKKILELGCGTGELAVSLAKNKSKITAIDFSHNSIKKARLLAKKMGVEKKIVFLEKNILEFDSKERFDIIIALGSLHHTINAEKGFSIASKHCKKNGLIIIGLYNKYSRLRHRLKRIILFLLCGKNFEKRIILGQKLFNSNKNIYWCADKFGQVHESYHSINEVMHWFKKNNITFYSSKPKFSKPVIDEIKWFFEKKNAFFVMVGTKK